MKEAVDYIYNIPKFSKKCSLDNTRELLNRLENPAQDKKIIHIAGTNGKGSVCAYLTNILMSEGYKVGTFTSPHLVKMNERISVNGVNISDAEFVEEYRKRCFVLGKKIDVISPNSIKSAIAVDINDDCALEVMYDNGSKDTIATGEISIKLK